MPAEQDQIKKKGTVSLSMMKRLGLGDIQVCLVPAGILFQHYLAGTHMELSLLLERV